MASQAINLRSVKPGEQASLKAPQSVAKAAKSGEHRALLVAMRDRIAETVTKPDCPPRDLASLTRRLQDIAKEIESIDAREDDDVQRRARQLEAALREINPEHPLLAGAVDDSYDADAI